jgi:hypothetical protein
MNFTSSQLHWRASCIYKYVEPQRPVIIFKNNADLHKKSIVIAEESVETQWGMAPLLFSFVITFFLSFIHIVSETSSHLFPQVISFLSLNNNISSPKL